MKKINDTSLPKSRDPVASGGRDTNRPQDSTQHDPSAQAADVSQFVMLQQPGPQAPAATAVGDRPALTTFIPPGRTGFAVPLNRIYAAEHLQIGDTIDLMASFSLEQETTTNETETRPDGTVIVRQSQSLSPRITQRTWEETLGNRAEPWFVATGAIVVAPVGFPAPAPALRAITASTAARANASSGRLSGPSVIIAVEDRDAESFATALSASDALFTVAFHSSSDSAQTDGGKDIAIAPETVPAFTQLIETTWHGNRRQAATRRVAASDPRFRDALSPRELRGLYGRVLRAEKRRGEFFTLGDFYPPGVSAGIAASARPGSTLLPVADREIEGLDSFGANDRVKILLRDVVQSPTGQPIGFRIGVATSQVVAPVVTIIRPSTAGQTVLEVANDDLTRLQAHLARSLSGRGGLGERSQLVAVGIARDSTVLAGDVPPFNPLDAIETTELFVNGRRSIRVFSGNLQ